jgi:mono/diheme cytochrome c family protein
MNSAISRGLVIAAAGMALLVWPASSRADEAADLFKAKCAMCHGADGAGKPAMKTRDFASADVQKQTDAELTAIVTKGKNKMPAYEAKLTKEQIAGLVAHIRTFAKKN